MTDRAGCGGARERERTGRVRAFEEKYGPAIRAAETGEEAGPVRCSTMRAVGLLAGVCGLSVLLGWAIGGAKGLQFGAVVAIGVVGLVGFFGGSLALRAMRARPVGEIEQADLYRIVRELATAARQPMPRLYLSPTPSPNAFATGTGPRGAAICCTTGLLRLLNERELRGVIAHELAHIRRGDTLVCSVAATLAVIITSLTALSVLLPLGDSEEENGPGPVGALLFLLLGPLAAGVVRAGIGRGREYRADIDAVRLTGDPVGLADALRKIDIGTRIHPLPSERPLLAAGHLMIARPFPARGIGRLFSVHPPAAERIRRLYRTAEEWGLR